MKTIIAPTDFSDLSHNAVHYAADMAMVLGFDLVLLHVVALPIAISEVPVSAYPYEELITEAEKKLTDWQKQLQVRTGNKIGIKTAVLQGYIVTQIKEYSETVDTYAVVMGTEQAGPLEKALAGATTFSAMAQLNCPVITVPQNAVFTGIHKIGIACDLKEVKETLPMDTLRKILSATSADLHVLHVDTNPDVFGKQQFDELVDLQTLLKDFHPHFHYMIGADIEKEVNSFVNTNKIEMLFVFPKKYSLLNRIFHKRHSRQLVMQTHIPVLSLHSSY